MDAIPIFVLWSLVSMKSEVKQPEETCEFVHHFLFPPTNAILAVPVNGAGRILCLPSMSPAPIQHERDPAIGLSSLSENC
ncbi:uncharacterized [Tachysurus ichikawai]